MNSRQRVLTALEHKSPDRTPCNYLGTPEADEKIKNHFKTSDLSEALLELGVDLRSIFPVYCGPELRKWPDGRYENLWGHVRKNIQNEAGLYSEAVEFPYANFQSLSDVETFRWPKIEWFDFKSLHEQCQQYKDFAIVFGSPGNMDLINGIAYGRGVEQVMLDIAEEDEIYLACMNKRFEFNLAYSEKALITCNGQIDILWCGDDLGTQNGLLISPEKWRKLFKPKLAQMCAIGHKYGAKVMMHSCGSTYPLWDDFIDSGVDIYDTVQPEAVGMNPADLKKRFGSKISFHGTISTQKTLPFGSVRDVENEVKTRIDTVGQNGGFILAPAHNIQPDTPLENILAVYKTVQTYTG
jgi:uroporphyrinogen decarboxylase